MTVQTERRGALRRRRARTPRRARRPTPRVMNARSALRRASRPDPSAPTSLDDVLGEPGLACLVFSFLPNARDRRNLARVCRVFHDASTRVASLPAAFDFTGVTTRLDAREFYKHLMRHDGVLDLPKERVHELLASLSHPLPRRTTDAETSSQGNNCLLYTSPSPRDQRGSRMPSSA